MSTNINTFPVSNLGKRGGKATSSMGVYGFQTPKGIVYLGFYQGYEATPDNLCTSGSRRLLSESEAMTYCTEGNLPVGFADRKVISGGFGKDDAKAEFKAAGAKQALGEVFGGRVAPTQVAEAPKSVATATAVSKPAIDKTAIIVAALAAGKSNDEVLALIAALG